MIDWLRRKTRHPAIDNLRVWWTRLWDTERYGVDLPAAFPEYLHEEWRARYGRQGAKTLFVPEPFWDIPGVYRMATWPKTDLAKILAEGGYHGIVLHVDDLFPAYVPGIVTDYDLNFVPRESIDQIVARLKPQFGSDNRGELKAIKRWAPPGVHW